MGGMQFPYISLCSQVVALSVYRPSNVQVEDACNSNCLVLQLQSAEESRTVTSSIQ